MPLPTWAKILFGVALIATIILLSLFGWAVVEAIWAAIRWLDRN